MPTTEERNLAAEQRAVEEGHRAYLAGNALRVVSDRIEGLHYLVRATSAGPDVVFRCEPEQWGHESHLQVHSHTPGHTPCKHAALAARRLERAGILAWEHGLWVVAPAEQARQAAKAPKDPFKGLPR